jgi:hypothetical protein
MKKHIPLHDVPSAEEVSRVMRHLGKHKRTPEEAKASRDRLAQARAAKAKKREQESPHDSSGQPH